MFNNEKIEALERRIRFLEDEVTTNRGYLWAAINSLGTDSQKLVKHLGLKFENVHERRIVEVAVDFPKEK